MIRKRQRLQVEISNSPHNAVFASEQSSHSLARISFLSILPVLVNGIASHTWHSRCESESIWSCGSWPWSDCHLRLEKVAKHFFNHTTTQPVILSWDNYIVLRVAPTSALPPTKCMPCQSICACAINLSLSVSFLSKAQWHHLAAGTWQNLKTDAAVPSFAPLCCSRNKLSAE